MSTGDGLHDEMRAFFARRPDSLVLDEVTAARLLSGRLDWVDAPPDYASVAQVIRAVVVPARPNELAGEADAVAAFRAAVRAKPAVAGRRRSLRLAALVTAGVLVLGGAAGAVGTGALPDGAQSVAHDALGAVGVSVPAPARTARTRPTPTRPSLPVPPATGPRVPRTVPAPSTPRRPPTPPRTRNPTDGLLLAACRAVQQGRISPTGSRGAQSAYRYLAVRAGGAANIAAYCQRVVSAAAP